MAGNSQKDVEQSAKENQSSLLETKITLPKGGGAIHSMGEKFAANPVTGTGSMSIPIATSSGRSGFGPGLSLSYDSGSGNGLFGLGWNLSLPSITRKTDKGLPKYQDANETDVFILSGAEDLVPVLVESSDGNWQKITLEPRTVGGQTYVIQRYRPRVEGLFARIEHWTNQADQSDNFWRSITKDNITTWYGKTAESRIADPLDPTHTFSWLICESCDDKGNVISYRYKRENSDNIDLSHIHERNRSPETRQANTYLKHILYGNRLPYLPLLTSTQPWPDLPVENAWLFEVVFDYGEHDLNNPLPQENAKQWPVRNDPFSSYRPGFEARTYRLCQRVLMFHHFPDEPEIGQNCLIRSTDFNYAYEQDPNNAQNPVFTLLKSVTQNSYKRQGANSYLSKALPPVEFEYSSVPSPAQLQQRPIRKIDQLSLENLPMGLDGSIYDWVDLDGEGLSGILTEQADGWFYKRNLSANHRVTDPQTNEQYTVAKFSPLENLVNKPNVTMTRGQTQLMDLAGDGQTDLVVMEGAVQGFYERTESEDWDSFQEFISWPNFNTRDPNLKFIDLTGDGHPDILITEDQAFVWHASLLEAGFGPAQRVMQVFDEEKGPHLIFADLKQSVFLADLSGDGLTDLVRIRNGEVCYWPNLGYCRFGPKVTMDNSPWFDDHDYFDQRRIRLADINGSGVTDILYLHRHGIRFYYNQSGNSWSAATELKNCPTVDSVKTITVADLLGNGTACLVWSSPLPGDSSSQMQYLDLMGSEKPHLLIKSVNNMGAEIRVTYAPSTKFYLDDKQAGKPWITKLPFPVHVVERVEIFDHLSCNCFVTRYAYHHGYFDGVEREFRGFGMVEQFDTEEFAALSSSGYFPSGDNIDAASHVPPVHTKTWFHTGVFYDREHISNYYAGLLNDQDSGEYYREPGLTDAQFKQLLLDDTVLPTGLTAEEEREACRALKGMMLRQEIYALDGTDRAQHPYSVMEQNFRVELLQKQGGNRYASFFSHPQEALTYHYERNPTDPRIAHAMTLEVDGFGNALKQIAIGYARRQPDPALPLQTDRDKQAQVSLIYTENKLTNSIDEDDNYRTPLAAEARTYELTGFSLANQWQRFQSSDFVKPDPNNSGSLIAVFDTEIHYEEQPSTGRQRRLIEQVCSLYRPNDLGAAQNSSLALLPLGQLQSLALPGESYKLAFTPGLLAKVYQRPHPNQPLEHLIPDPAALLSGSSADRGGYYVDLNGNGHWWIPSGRLFFSLNVSDNPNQELDFARQHFFLPHRSRDPFHTHAVSTESLISYDRYDLLVQEIRDPLSNRVTVGERDASENLTLSGHDYRVLQPKLMMDANRNRAAVAFDVLGMVVGTAIMGKPEENLGDNLDNFAADLDEAVILNHLANPLADPHAILQNATTRLVYDVFAYYRTKNDAKPQGAVVYTLVRETHADDLTEGQQTKIQHSFSYSDGFGREIQKKIQAEPGPVPQRDSNGQIIIGANGQPEMTATNTSPRWVGSGWTVFNNKGKPVRQYEPFFTDIHRFEFDVKAGVSPVLFYDPAERVVATLNPNHTWQKVIFDPWRQESWDVNDTALIADPKNDPDVGDFFRRLPDADYLPTWYGLRADAANAVAFAALYPAAQDRDNETQAARKTELHAATPGIAHADALGRSFLTIAHNRFKFSNANTANPPQEEFYATRVNVDIEGNQREVIDAKDRIVMRYDYDMLGTRIHQASMEAGERWLLNDAMGKPLYAWDNRDHRFRTAYDALRRPIMTFLQDGIDAAEMQIGRSVYGENQPNPEANNLRGKVYQVFDQAGVVTTEGYDFKGNLTHSSRTLADNYKTTIDWQTDIVQPTWETFSSSTDYDALNRPLTVTAPDSSIYLPGFNEANLLETVDVQLRGSATATRFVNNIDYDAKGQRQLIEYGNHARTHYDYDPTTFRLIRLNTQRSGDNAVLQDLHYSYDPAGNITFIRDTAQQTLFFNNQIVEPSTDYLYDAVYRLIEATGREHLGQAGGAPFPHSYNDAPRVGLVQPGDGNAMGNYLERYVYDAVGNFLEFQHRGSNPANPGWTRSYAYNEISLLESGKASNRLSNTTIQSSNGNSIIEPYGYDAHGNMLHMPQLQVMQWDFHDQLQMSQRQKVNDADADGIVHQGERTWYVYDGSGQRVRKVTERQNGTRMKERIYVGGFEVYREYGGDGVEIRLERECLQVMDDTQRIALVETRTDTTTPEQTIRYQFGNHLGSASLELDAAGQLISYEEYFPYGSTAYQAGRSQAEVSLKRYRYTGMERDEESGLNYHSARYYATWLGRWVSCDSAGTIDGYNLYAFCRHNPVIYVDQDGTNSDKLSRQIEENRRTLEAEKQNLAKIKQELNSLESRRAQAERQIEKSSAELSELNTKGLSDKAVEKETERLNRIIAEKTVVHTEAVKNAKDAAARLSASDQRIKEMQDKSRELTTKLGQRANKAAEAQLRKAEEDLKPKKEGLLSRLVKKIKGSRGGPGGTGTSSMTNITLSTQRDVLEGLGPEKDAFETEIEDFAQWGFDMFTGLARGGPASAFKAALDPQRLGKAAVIAMQSPHMFGARGGFSALATECMNPANCMRSTVDRSEQLKISQAIVQQLNDIEALKAAGDLWYVRDFFTLDVSVLSSSNGRNYAGPLAGRSYLPIYIYR